MDLYAYIGMAVVNTLVVDLQNKSYTSSANIRYNIVTYGWQKYDLQNRTFPKKQDRMQLDNAILSERKLYNSKLSFGLMYSYHDTIWFRYF